MFKCFSVNILDTSLFNTSFFTLTIITATYQNIHTINPVGKIAEKAVCSECIFDNMALYFSA